MLNTAILLTSFSEHMPDHTLHICDFGMSDNESQFWRQVGGYLSPPSTLPIGLHPWKYKASVCEFMDISSYDAVVWLDADMVLMAPLHQQVEKIVRTMKANETCVAATPDVSNVTVAEAMSGFSVTGKNVEPFAHLIARHDKNVTDKYLNTGFLIICDYDFSSSWQRETMEQGDWVLFEQNTFNALLSQEKNQLYELETEIWNVHGDLLADVDIMEQSRAANILHTTSSEQRHHIENHIQYPIGHKVLPGWFKLFTREDLRDLQQKYLLHFLQTHLSTLETCNMLSVPSHA